MATEGSEDRKGLLLVNFVHNGETVRADHHSEALYKLRKSVRRKLIEMLSRGVKLLHDLSLIHI